MHHFQFCRKKPAPNHIYALMNGMYCGGSAAESDIRIDTQIPFLSIANVFRLVVSDDGVKISTYPNSSIEIQINGTKPKTPLTDFIIEPGDCIEIGRNVFELVKHEPAMSQKNISSGRHPCHHPHNPLDERKSIYRIDCPYPKCPFACWCIADLNNHFRADDGHQGKRLSDPKPLNINYC